MKLVNKSKIIAAGLLVLMVVGYKPLMAVSRVDTLLEKNTCLEIVVDTEFQENHPNSKIVDIRSAKIVDDCLVLSIRQGGGCPKQPNIYTLVWDKVILKSKPPQVVLSAYLDSNDVCESIPEKELNFDLRSLRIASPVGELIVRIKGLEKHMNYRFVMPKNGS